MIDTLTDPMIDTLTALCIVTQDAPPPSFERLATSAGYTVTAIKYHLCRLLALELVEPVPFKGGHRYVPAYKGKPDPDAIRAWATLRHLARNIRSQTDLRTSIEEMAAILGGASA